MKYLLLLDEVMSEDGSLSVAVGIPTMNNEDTIEETLRNLAHQTRPPNKVIVVDASTDSTPDIVERVNESTDIQIEYYRQLDYGRGVGGARHQIYREFEEDVLVCLDTDHDVRSDWLETHVRFHRENPEYGVLSNSGRQGFDKEVRNPKKSEYFGQSNCSLKREALDRVEGWDPWFPRGEDWDMRIRLWSAGVKSYAKHDIDAWRYERDIPRDTLAWFRKKVTGSPSSVTFLRKYGYWYLKFHPVHVVGDFLSLVSLVFLALVPLGLLVYPPSLLLFLGLPLILSLTYLYYKGPRKRDGFGLKRKDFTAVPVFFALGLSALYNLRRVGEDVDWNYSGFKNAK